MTDHPQRPNFRAVLVTAADGTQSLLGTVTGLPFTSEQLAQRLAAVIVAAGLDATVLELERSDDWARGGAA